MNTYLQAASRPVPVRAAVLAILQAATLPAHAAETASPQQLPKISVDAQQQEESSYKADAPSSPKYTEPLLDTPQSITIIPNRLIEDQKLLTLREILSTVPGITFGAGEGGGGYGDSITLRGFAGSADITIDGVRDSNQYSRTDPFNLQQVEVVNGASSVYSGAGSVGGNINLVTKQAHAGDRSLMGVSMGTDNYRRFSADANQQFTNSTALRVNAMAHRNDVAGRDVEKFERWGIAPSLVIGLDSNTTLTLNYVHQEDENVPQYGVPFINGRSVPGVDNSTYYGYSNVDKQEIETDGLTAILTHRFGDALSLRNLARIQDVDQFSLVDAPQGTFCLSSGVQPSGAACPDTVPPGQFLPNGTGPRGLGRETTNRIVYNQTDLTLTFPTGGIEHTMVTGFAFSHETYTLTSTNEFRNPDGTNPYASGMPLTDMYNPDNVYRGPINRTLSGKNDGELDNVALYVFDTLEFSKQWQLNGGIRYEQNEGSTLTYTVQGPASDGGLPPAGSPPIGTITGASAPAKNSDDLFSYRAGLIYKPRENGTLYVSYGNAKTPSKNAVNGSCNLVPTTNTGANCNLDPESAVNYEVGVKWDLFDHALALTAAVYRNERQNYRVNDPDPLNLSGVQTLDGRARVDGLLLGAGGNITPAWAVSANYSYLDSEVLQGASDYSSATGQDYTKGDPLLSVPQHALTLWTAYQLNERWQFGYGATYQGEIYLTQHSTSNRNGPLLKAAGYTTHRLMANYTFNDAVDLQLNVNNLFDKEYYTRIRTSANGWATPGEGRTLIASASYRF